MMISVMKMWLLFLLCSADNTFFGSLYLPCNINIYHLGSFQAKQLCLSITRTIILERRPVPVVAMAIDVLLTAYSHAIKTGSYYKKIVAEETSQSGASNINKPKPAVNDSTGIDASGKFIKQGPESGSENESYTRSDVPTSDPDGSLIMNSNLPDPSVGSERGYLLEPGMSGAEDLPAGQSQILGPSNNQSNSNAPERHQNQVTSSAATSPADLYSCVFAQVEEEIAGDGSYLVAIIVEFLRR